MRGQVTIEFILILVIMLVILATISLPVVGKMEQDVTDTGNAVNLAAIQYRVANTAKELSLAGCGSHKTIRVHLPFDEAEKRVSWDNSNITASYYKLNNDLVELKDLPYPASVNISGSEAVDGYWDVRLEKNCNGNTAGCVGTCE